MSKVLTPDGAKRVLSVVQHFRATTPSQHNRGHFSQVIAASVEEGAKTIADLATLNIAVGDIKGAFEGKRIVGVSDEARTAVLDEVQATAERVLGWN